MEVNPDKAHRQWQEGGKRGWRLPGVNPGCSSAWLPHGPSPGDQEHSRTLIWKTQLRGRPYPGGVQTSQTAPGGSSCLCF